MFEHILTKNDHILALNGAKYVMEVQYLFGTYNNQIICTKANHFKKQRANNLKKKVIK